MSDSLWYLNAVFYEVYVRAFYDSNADGQGDLRGIIQKLDYLQNLGVDCIWLLPMYPSPQADDGYDIADYYNIHPDYGTLDDFKDLLEAAHARGIRIIIDLVLNHTSDQHPWFQAARANRNSPYREYYVWSDTDRRYREARIIFIDSEQSNWTWDPVAGQYYWHRFYACQPDLNFDNQAVRDEMFKIMEFWLNLGVDGFRVDAVPYLFEREGTNCENLPETHIYLKAMRHFVDERYPDRILLCEANQWPKDVRTYFDEGEEFHMGFHFPLMPRIFMALRRADREPILWATQETPTIPGNCQWCTFLRNHDELTLEMVTQEERHWMWQEYAPKPKMRLNLGIRRRLAPLLENDHRKIELAYSLLFTLPGSPIIYYGDEIGMGDNIKLPDRDGVRTPMQWDTSPQAGFSTAKKLYAPLINRPPNTPAEVNVADQRADPGSLWQMVRKMIAMRKSQPALRGKDIAWIDCNNPAIAAYIRTCGKDRLLVLNNLSGQEQSIQVRLPWSRRTSFKDVLSKKIVKTRKPGQLSISLSPHQFLWLAC